LTANDLEGSAPRWLWLVPVATVMLHGAGNLLWFWLCDGGVVGGVDVFEHLNHSITLASRACRDALSWTDLLYDPVVPTWPTTAYLPGWLLLPLTGSSHAALVWTSGMLYLALCVFATYLLGRDMVDPPTGAMAAALVALVPGIYGLSRKYGLDLPLTGVLTLCVWRVHLLGERSPARDYLVAGLLGGLCLLVKLQALFFLIVPFAVKLAGSLRRQPAVSRWGLALAALALRPDGMQIRLFAPW